jgi:uncharacterized DUF497 family protein
MKIEDIIWHENIVNKLASKHNVEIEEVEEVFDDSPMYHFTVNGNREGENVYTLLGQTDAGRYLTVIFIHKKKKKH